MSTKPHVDYTAPPMPAGRRALFIIVFAIVFGIIAGTLSFRMTSEPQASLAPAKIEPAKLEKVAGTELNRVILTEKAAQRLDIQTAPVREEQVAGAMRTVIPYAALIYDLEGKAWVYASPEPLTFVRQPIAVADIEGEIAVLAEGPPTGTQVATVGVAELYGADTGIGK